MNMLSLLPIPGLSGLRNKAKSAELKRRDSSSNIYSQSLPNAARRFSGYEELGPLFQSLVVVQDSQKCSSLKRHNLHQSVKARSGSSSRNAAGCDELDAKIARIKGQLTRLKSDHMDMNHRVDDLTSSVGQLYQSNKHRVVHSAVAAVAERPSSTASSSLSGSSLESFVEGANERSATTQTVDDSPRIDCLQNNLGKPRSKSAAQLSVIRNDFSSAAVLARKSSCKSDSVIFVQRNRAARVADQSKMSAEMH